MPSDGRKKLRLYGLNLGTKFPFRSTLLPATGAVDLILDHTVAPLGSSDDLGDWDGSDVESERVYSSPIVGDDGDSVLRLVRRSGKEILHYGADIAFEVEANRIRCRLRGHQENQENQVNRADPDTGLAEIAFLGSVMAYWLERQGIVALHAAAVQIGDAAVAFVGRRGAGKSSLAAALVRAGHKLLTDDILPVELSPEIDGDVLRVRPGYPQMRLWPPEAERFAGSVDFDRVLPTRSKLRVPASALGGFCDSSLPLGAVFLLERAGTGSDFTVSSLPPAHQVVELVRNSFSPYIVEAIGLQKKRLDIFARIAENSPVCRLKYPGGWRHLSRIREAILRHLAD